MPPPIKELGNKPSLSRNATASITTTTKRMNTEQVKRQRILSEEDIDKGKHLQLPSQQSDK